MDHHLKSACEHFIQQQTAQFVEPLEHFMAKVRASRAPGGSEFHPGFPVQGLSVWGALWQAEAGGPSLSDSVWEVTALLSVEAFGFRLSDKNCCWSFWLFRESAAIAKLVGAGLWGAGF